VTTQLQLINIIIIIIIYPFISKIHRHVFANGPSNEPYRPAVMCTLKGLKVYLSPLSYSACILTTFHRIRTGQQASMRMTT